MRSAALWRDHGWPAARGMAHMTMLADLRGDEEMTSTWEKAPRMGKFTLELLADLDTHTVVLDPEIARLAKEDEAARRLMTIPGLGAVAAAVILAPAPPIQMFRAGQDFAARLGQVLRRHSAQNGPVRFLL